MPDPHGSANGETRGSPLVPRAISNAALGHLEQVAGGLVAAGISANAVTAISLGLAAMGAVFLATGHLGPALAAMVAASIGDALDGLVARNGGTASVGGALLDAASDRYQEFFLFTGLVVFFHDSIPELMLALFALAGSFMVSYGSAKAEALGVDVPGGVMRRAERALCLCVGVAVAAAFGWLAQQGSAPEWAARATLVATVAVIALGANVSAVRRLRAVALARSAVKVARSKPPSDPVPLHVPRDTLLSPQRGIVSSRSSRVGRASAPPVRRRWPT
jgi:CDP-diacylglycerol---glycerol-3-phosphate 3-phosphatidyltransferase